MNSLNKLAFNERQKYVYEHGSSNRDVSSIKNKLYTLIVLVYLYTKGRDRNVFV